MLNINTKSGGFVTSLDWKEILKILIAVLTAIAGTLGVISCAGEQRCPSHPSSRRGRGRPSSEWCVA